MTLKQLERIINNSLSKRNRFKLIGFYGDKLELPWISFQVRFLRYHNYKCYCWFNLNLDNGYLEYNDLYCDPNEDYMEKRFEDIQEISDCIYELQNYLKDILK